MISYTGALGAQDRMWHRTGQLKVSDLTAIQQVAVILGSERWGVGLGIR